MLNIILVHIIFVSIILYRFWLDQKFKGIDFVEAQKRKEEYLKVRDRAGIREPALDIETLTISFLVYSLLFGGPLGANENWRQILGNTVIGYVFFLFIILVVSYFLP